MGSFRICLASAFLVAASACAKAGSPVSTAAAGVPQVAAQSARAPERVSSPEVRSASADAPFRTLVTGVTDGFYGVRGGSRDDLYAVGRHGLVLHSPDGGASWKAPKTGVTDQLYAAWVAGADA